jgi:hypothetical protein
MELVKATQADYKKWAVVIVPPSSSGIDFVSMLPPLVLQLWA